MGSEAGDPVCQTSSDYSPGQSLRDPRPKAPVRLHPAPHSGLAACLPVVPLPGILSLSPTVLTLHALGSQLYPVLATSPTLGPPMSTPPSSSFFSCDCIQRPLRGPKPIFPMPVPTMICPFRMGAPSPRRGRRPPLKCREGQVSLVTCVTRSPAMLPSTL